ncbi:MAG: PIN domain-containing protein [Mesorhizobium sp.]|nr:PIN domain-containing protein [Mesorhizobium sp.]
MSGFLIDTSVLSIFAADRPAVPLPLKRWIVEKGTREALLTSSIVVLETKRGIAKLRRAGGLSRADRLETWLTSMLVDFEDRTLPVDTAIASLAGEIEDAAIARGRSPGLADVLIAATARVHDLTVLTSNARHFGVLGVAHFDPLTSPLPA